MKSVSATNIEITTVLVLSSKVERFEDIDPIASDTPNQLILQGITEAGLSERISVPVQFLDQDDVKRIADPLKRPPALQRGEVAGIIICSYFARQLMDILGSEIPFVVIPKTDKALNIDSAGPEHLHGTEQLVRHLHALGHRRIGFVGTEERATWMHDRFAGYLYGMNSLGLDFDLKAVLNMTGDKLSDRELLRNLVLATRKKVATAWVCASDGLAAGVYHVLRDAGIKVPADVSITGFDGISHLRDCPALTTLVVPWRDIGEGALFAMIDRIRKPHSAVSHREYMGKLCNGATTAPLSRFGSGR